MKVLLIRPIPPNKLSFTKVLDNEPLELEYLHTVLAENGYEDYIYDGLVEKNSVTETILREKPDIVAITGYITQQNIMLKYCAIAKEVDPNIITIIGGVHAQLNYKSFYDKNVDYIARSESINAFIELIRYIDSGNGDIDTINGICHRNGDNYIINELRPFDINLLPIPDRTHFYTYRKSYRYLDLTEIATVKTSISCTHNCTFCYCTLLGDGKYKARDINLVIQEIAQLNCENIQIVDDNFLSDIPRVREFVRLIKEHNIRKTYVCFTRADSAAKNPDIIQELAEIGFKYFLVGLEAVDDTTLQAFNKKTTDEINGECVRVIHSTQASCIGLFVISIDAEKKDFDAIYDWVVKHGLKYVTVSIFTPIPGTKLYEEYEERLTSKRIEDWDFLHLVLEPTKMSKSRYYSEYYKLFVKLYNIAQKTGIYDFMDLKYYRDLLGSYLKRKMRAG